MNFQVINEESPLLVDELVEGVRTFVHEQLGDETTLPLSVIARDDNGALMGGVSGRTIYSNFLIGVVWVDKKYRGTGLGRKLMESAETEAIGRGCNTNQYKDVIAQREFSASEVRSLIAPALTTFTTSMWLATSDKHSCSTFKLVNTASGALKLACKECFWLPTSALNDLTRE